jgi:hypothetical protein
MEREAVTDDMFQQPRKAAGRYTPDSHAGNAFQ